ncbi:MAG: gliding motility-associated C-terminal domain-containing protein [Bacteroidetes bacterium]|nr:MAG: gliding motility-associated C-terminal domain-containing protein [Bacteroidota bacterium]
MCALTSPLWFDGKTTTTTTVRSPGTYYASVTNQCGTATDSTIVTLAITGCSSPLQDTLPAIYLPIAFTPNGDGVNDYFGVAMELEFESFSLIIFDRLGNRVFKTNRPKERWNGTLMNSGEPLMLGSYVYQIKYVTLIERRKGSVNGYVMIAL